MRKKEKHTDVESKSHNKSKKAFYIFLTILSAIMIAMAIVSFLLGEPQYAISKGIIFVFATIAILLVFDSIESLSVGNILSLKTKVKEKEKEVDKLSAENAQLRNQFISVMATTFNKQSVYVGYPKDYVVEKADKKESDEEETTPLENERAVSNNTSTESQTRSHTNRRSIMPLLENLLLDRFKENNSVADINLRKEVKITNIGISSDPIIERDIIYDAYIKRPMDEIFIEISNGMMSGSMLDFRLYFMISRVYYYSQANKVKAKLILILPQFTEEYISKHPEEMRYYSPARYVQRLKDTFKPAIQNELFEIVGIKITDEDMQRLEAEAQKQDTYR